MSVPKQYLKPDSWPHIFTPKLDANKQPTEKPFMDPQRGPQLAKLYHCMHCQMLWWQNQELRPTGACPKRIDMIEQRRLRGMI